MSTNDDQIIQDALNEAKEAASDFKLAVQRLNAEAQEQQDAEELNKIKEQL